MIIQTKYDVGDEVWLVYNGRALYTSIKEIFPDVLQDRSIIIRYTCKEHNYNTLESKIFETKEEAENYIIKQKTISPIMEGPY